MYIILYTWDCVSLDYGPMVYGMAKIFLPRSLNKHFERQLFFSFCFHWVQQLFFFGQNETAQDDAACTCAVDKGSWWRILSDPLPTVTRPSGPGQPKRFGWFRWD